MRKWKYCSAMALAMMIVFTTVLAGCGSEKQQTNTASPAATPVTSTEPATEKQPVTIKMFQDAKGGAHESNLKLIEDFEKETGIKVEFNIIPGDGVEVYKKIDISVSTGDTTDIIYLSNPLLLDKYSQGGWLLELNDLIAEDNYDAEAIYGSYLTKYDGKLYTLPNYAGKWAVYYNKKIFDDAGVPYPRGNWTWDEYIETAKKLTDRSNGIYGSYMLDYDAYMYFMARQKDVSGYKSDGSSNYDDPAYAEALQLFSDLGSVHKVQPSWMEFRTKKLSWDGFMSGNYGMHLIGSWYTDMFADKGSYPRDWKFGITQIPVPSDGTGNNNLISPAGIGVNKNSKHPKEAFQFVKYWAENYYKYLGTLPARSDLNDEDLTALFKGVVEKLDGEITVEDLQSVLFDPNMGIVDEKIVGPGANEYSNIILQESELFLVGQNSLEDAIKEIKKRADQAIEEDLKNK